MKWIRTQEQSIPAIARSVLTIGNFDGVHLGHRELLAVLTDQARAENAPAVVCTFKPHPLQVLRPELSIQRLFDYRDQAEIMGGLGVDFLIEEKFTKEMSMMTAQDFMDMYIVRHFNPFHIVVGYDFSFGRDRSGDIEFLRKYCEARRIRLTQVAPIERAGQIISSTAIRKLIEHGDMLKAEEYLGRKYYLRGPVIVGYQRGRTIGIPTANMSPEIDFIPRKGVYFSRTFLDDRVFPSVTNIGVNPTFAKDTTLFKVETHIFNFDRDIYGAQIKVELDFFHRDEIQFSGVDALRSQIEKDMFEARRFYKI